MTFRLILLAGAIYVASSTQAFEFPQYRVKVLPHYTNFNSLAGINNRGDAVISSGLGVFYIGADGNTFQIPNVSRGVGLNDAGQASVMR